MDAHFREYLAALAGMEDVYGVRDDDRPTDFHDDTVPGIMPTVEVEVETGSHWDV